MTALLDKADTKVSHWTEDALRRLSRRRFLTTGIKGAATALAGLTVGIVVDTETAQAVPGPCSPPSCGYCSCRGLTCPSGGGCPAGCTTCKSPSCDSQYQIPCPYPDGNWTISCGRCGLGYIICTDCKCPDCAHLCGCASQCFCSGCCSPPQAKQAKVDMARRLALLKGAGVGA